MVNLIHEASSQVDPIYVRLSREKLDVRLNSDLQKNGSDQQFQRAIESPE